MQRILPLLEINLCNSVQDKYWQRHQPRAKETTALYGASSGLAVFFRVQKFQKKAALLHRDEKSGGRRSSTSLTTTSIAQTKSWICHSLHHPFYSTGPLKPNVRAVNIPSSSMGRSHGLPKENRGEGRGAAATTLWQASSLGHCLRLAPQQCTMAPERNKRFSHLSAHKLLPTRQYTEHS